MAALALRGLCRGLPGFVLTGRILQKLTMRPRRTNSAILTMLSNTSLRTYSAALFADDTTSSSGDARSLSCIPSTQSGSGRESYEADRLDQMGKRRYMRMESLLNPAKQEAAAIRDFCPAFGRSDTGR